MPVSWSADIAGPVPAQDLRLESFNLALQNQLQLDNDPSSEEGSGLHSPISSILDGSTFFGDSFRFDLSGKQHVHLSTSTASAPPSHHMPSFEYPYHPFQPTLDTPLSATYSTSTSSSATGDRFASPGAASLSSPDTVSSSAAHGTVGPLPQAQHHPVPVDGATTTATPTSASTVASINTSASSSIADFGQASVPSASDMPGDASAAAALAAAAPSQQLPPSSVSGDHRTSPLRDAAAATTSSSPSLPTASSSTQPSIDTNIKSNSSSSPLSAAAGMQGSGTLTVTSPQANVSGTVGTDGTTVTTMTATAQPKTNANGRREGGSMLVIACKQCRARKIRCDSTRPTCHNCSRRSTTCEYDAVPKRRGPDKKPGTRQRSCKKRPAHLPPSAPTLPTMPTLHHHHAAAQQQAPPPSHGPTYLGSSTASGMYGLAPPHAHGLVQSPYGMPMSAAGGVPPASAGVHAALDNSGAWKRKHGMSVSPLQPPPLPSSEPPSISKRARIDTSEMRMIEPPSAGMPTGLAMHAPRPHSTSSPTQPGARLSVPTSGSPSHGADGAPTPGTTAGGSLRRKRPHNLSIDTAIGYGLQPHVQVHQHQQLSALSSAGYSAGVSQAAMSARPPMSSSALGSGGAYGYEMVTQDHQHLIQRPRSDSKSKDYRRDQGTANLRPEHARLMIPGSPSTEYSRTTWWETLLTSYSSSRDQSLRDIASSLIFLYSSTAYFLPFIDVDALRVTLSSSSERWKLQPAFIYSSLALATLIKSSQIEQGAVGRARALWLRDAAQSELEKAWACQSIDVSLAEAAVVMALFESSSHPQFTVSRRSSAMTMMDNIIKSTRLTLLDDLDPTAPHFAPDRVPIVAMTPLPPYDQSQRFSSSSPMGLSPSSGHAQASPRSSGMYSGNGGASASGMLRHPPARCACISPSSLEANHQAQSWAYVPRWDPNATVAERMREECRRVCWSALSLVATRTSEESVFGRDNDNASANDLWLADPANYSLLFPGESLERATYSPSSAPSLLSPKESVWGLYCRSMLLWQYCARLREAEERLERVRAKDPSGMRFKSDPILERTIEDAVEAWNETQMLTDALEMHVCNIDTALMYICREYIYNSRLTLTQALRSVHGLDANASGVVPVFNRKQAEEWLHYQDQVIKRVKLSVHHLGEVHGHLLTRRPFQVSWFIAQLALCLSLWNGDHTLFTALDLAKSIIVPVDILNTLWPCSMQEYQAGDLRKSLEEACVAAGLPPPLPREYSLPQSLRLRP